MCGVAAILGINNSNVNSAQIRKMVSALHHRGPDDNGTWVGDGVALGHTRLSIIELSKSGSQPMTSADHRWIISFNGEIYNHLDLRKSLTCD